MTYCCRSKCHLVCTPEVQKNIFASYHKATKEAQDNIIYSGISVSSKKSERKGRSKTGQEHFRNITAKYGIKIDNERITVCKKIYMCVYGISRGKIDAAIQKIRACTGSSFPEGDRRGRHESGNKMDEVRNAMKEHIERYPKYDSHYSRSHTGKTYMPSYLNMSKMYDEYKTLCQSEGETKYGSYDLFKKVFHQTGYKFKQPAIDTCRACDMYEMKIKQCKSTENKSKMQLEFESHKQVADEGYAQKRIDKENCSTDVSKVVLVFDLQKVLNTPSLTTNIAYYKRLLSTYNLTIRDCSKDGGTDCFMWYEAIGGRGSHEIASCLYKKILSLPESINHIITYSDTCGGQNRNINMAIMLSYVVSYSEKKNSISIIDQKFLLPGHTHLECDADHARIERAKKSSRVSIMVPRDWYTFVRTVRGKSKFKVTVMTQDDFMTFSQFLRSTLIKKTLDSENEKVSWLKIRWIRYEKPFGILKFKYSLKEDEPFRILDLRRLKRSSVLQNKEKDIELLGRCYSEPLAINTLKKSDLLSILDLIDEDCHTFYKNLRTANEAPEVDFDNPSDGEG